MCILKKRLSLLANVFPIIRTPKERVRYVSKKYRFKVLFHKQHGKRIQTLLKWPWRHFYHTYSAPRMILSWKKSLLVKCKMLWLFVNRFTAGDKYSPLNRDNLTQPFQKQLSQKWKCFSQLSSAVLISALNLEHFQKKVDPRSQCISEIKNSQKGG